MHFLNFLFHNYTINKQLKMLPVASACGSHYHSLTSQVDLINTAEMGKGEFHACFVNSKVAIIS